jgi:glycosyltransferase involved in cell wall biosynthesis
MKVLMISTDAHIVEVASKEYKRMQSYATVTEELHIIVCTTSQVGVAPFKEGNLFIYPTNSLTKLFYGLGILRIALRLKKRGVSIVTVQDPFETGLMGLGVAFFLNAALQVQIHTDFFTEYFAYSFKNIVRKYVARFVIPRADGVRVVSERLKKAVMAQYVLKREPTVLPIYAEVPLTLFSERGDLLKKKYPQFGTILLMVSRLEGEKHIEMALTAFRSVVNDFPGMGLVVVGGGSEEVKLKRLIIEFGLEQKVIFDGWQPNPIDYFKSADFFLNTSHYEGYGRTLIEAALAGVPIVTTDVGIVGEVLNQENAFISPPKDVITFTQQLREALLHKEIAKEKAGLAREAIEAYLSLTEQERLYILKTSWEACIRK